MRARDCDNTGMRALLDAAADLLLGSACPGCDRPGWGVCAGCLRELRGPPIEIAAGPPRVVAACDYRPLLARIIVAAQNTLMIAAGAVVLSSAIGAALGLTAGYGPKWAGTAIMRLADVIMSFMPGTNTTMDSFYTATATTGITALTRWEVENARAGTSVAGLVVKQGAFPQLGGNIFATGPQNNDMAEELGAKYADFAAGIHVITPGTPVVSVEHSFGSSVGGVAETQDAGFHTRITLSGIGMTSDYGPSLDTDHYAMRSPNDILDQLHVKETQIFNWGYQHAPTPENGFTELDSGIPGTPAWAQIGKVISPPIAIGDLASGLDHHNQIISGDISENRVVLETINDVIWNAAR